MVIIVKGNILNCTEDIIVHQVNCQGIMGGGVARQLANHYKKLENIYFEHCVQCNMNYQTLKGTVFMFASNQGKIIGNMFSQKPNFDTDYHSMKIALQEIKCWAKNRNLSVCMPYGIGCGIANGDWNIVFELIQDVFKDYEVTLYKLEE